MKFEYIRHGITNLIDPLEVATGRTFPPYLNETRGKADLHEIVSRVVETAPERNRVSVCDGLNTHKPETPVKYAAETCGAEEDPG